MASHQQPTPGAGPAGDELNLCSLANGLVGLEGASCLNEASHQCRCKDDK